MRRIREVLFVGKAIWFRTVSRNVVIFFTATFLFMHNFVEERNVELGWDDSEVIRLSKCFSYDFWIKHTLPSSECINNQWRSPLFQFMLGLSPYSDDVKTYSNRVFVIYGLILGFLIWQIMMSVASKFSGDSLLNLALFSLIMVMLYASAGSSWFSSFLQVDGLLCLVLILYSILLVEIVQSKEIMLTKLLFLVALNTIAILLKFSAIAYLVSTAIVLFLCFRKEPSHKKDRIAISAMFVAILSAPTMLYVLDPSSILSAASVANGYIGDFYATHFAIDFLDKLKILQNFLLPFTVLIFVAGRFFLRNRKLDSNTLFLSVYFALVNTMVLTQPITDFHYLAPFAIPFIMFLFFSFTSESKVIK